MPPSEVLAMLLGGLCLLAGAACGASQAPAKGQLPADVGELPASLEDEFAAFATNCSKCHGLERALTAPVADHKHWQLYVGKMMRTPGSGISAQEAPHILAFLFWYTDRKTGRIPAESTSSGANGEPHSLAVPNETVPPPGAEVQPMPAAPVEAPAGEGSP